MELVFCQSKRWKRIAGFDAWLRLACHNHIIDLMLKSVLFQAFGASTSPEILIFKRFKKSWNIIKHTGFNTVISDAPILKQVKNITT